MKYSAKTWSAGCVPMAPPQSALRAYFGADTAACTEPVVKGLFWEQALQETV